MAEVSDSVYSTLIDLRASDARLTARESAQVQEWISIARARENLTPAGISESVRLAQRLRNKYSAAIEAFRNPAPSAEATRVADNARAAFGAGPTRTPAQADALARVLGDSTTVAAQASRTAASPSSSGTGNS
jgi:hypothetical protein